MAKGSLAKDLCGIVVAIRMPLIIYKKKHTVHVRVYKHVLLENLETN